ncbi:MAG: hypothetical protein [Tongren Rhabd tick virus 1]|uniref:Uncharacterized protein n=1 Tax=Tongren Rhabd tick virus 1 TaxID=2972325 RepID=A0A9E7V288_9RHAB|nr:MAG: hypothetical protein [Tongren Rhabd tick virus 1]
MDSEEYEREKARLTQTIRRRHLSRTPSVPISLSDNIDHRDFPSEAAAPMLTVKSNREDPHFLLVVGDPAIPGEIKSHFAALSDEPLDPGYWRGVYEMWTHLAKAHFTARHAETRDQLKHLSDGIVTLQQHLVDNVSVLRSAIDAIKTESDKVTRAMAGQTQQTVAASSALLSRPALPPDDRHQDMDVRVSVGRHPDGRLAVSKCTPDNNTPGSITVANFLNTLSEDELGRWIKVPLSWLAAKIRVTSFDDVKRARVQIWEAWQHEKHLRGVSKAAPGHKTSRAATAPPPIAPPGAHPPAPTVTFPGAGPNQEYQLPVGTVPVQPPPPEDTSPIVGNPLFGRKKRT